MEGVSQLQSRILIANFFAKHRDLGKPFTVDHFKKMGVSRAKVYRVLSKIGGHDNTDVLARKVGSGGSNKKIKGSNLVKLEMTVNRQTGKSQLFGVWRSTVKLFRFVICNTRNTSVILDLQFQLKILFSLKPKTKDKP